MGIRLSGIAALAAAAVIVGACSTMDMDVRHLEPIPSKLIGQMAAKGMTPRDPILIRIYKQESELEIWKRDRTGRYALLKTYPMCRWSGKLGPKRREGDRQAPEGFYSVTPGRMNPRSDFYLAFNLGYPNPLEEALGYSGAALMVHGACTSAGCYAMTDDGVAEIYAVAREAFGGGQRSFQVQALPFRMTPRNLAAHRGDPNYAFWQNLREGAAHFDVTGQPPTVGYCGGRYVFDATPVDPSQPVDPLAPCPALAVDTALAESVAAHQQTEAMEAAALIASGTLPPPGSYVDGGMHPYFRRILASSGPERLARMTSLDEEVSRPDAALADPYTPADPHTPAGSGQ